MQTWKDNVAAPLQSRLKTNLNMTIDEVDVVGMKAYVEASGKSTQKNGRPYNNR